MDDPAPWLQSLFLPWVHGRHLYVNVSLQHVLRLVHGDDGSYSSGKPRFSKDQAPLDHVPSRNKMI